MNCRCGCGRPASGRLGFTEPCRSRWYSAGRPDVLPPPRWMWAGRHSPGTTRADRIEDYRELRSWKLSRAEAADRLGLHARTIDRYEAELRARGLHGTGREAAA